MESISSNHLYVRLHNKKRHFPLRGQIELTHRCSLNCIHCYCKGNEGKDKELTTDDWKKILDLMWKEGCIWVTLTGGDPLARSDFLEIYAYAKERGFLISIFTNGLLFKQRIVDYLKKIPPYCIEITLNGITKDTYESITQVEGSFSKVMDAIKVLVNAKLPLKLKSNCLKENKNEIAQIKAFVDGFLGKTKGKYYFRYDPMIYPKLNKDRAPCNHRLSFKDLFELRKQDPDIWQEYQKCRDIGVPYLKKDTDLLYWCNSWMQHFFISPYGRLKFCIFSEKFSIDLKTTSFREGFYNVFPKLLNEKFKTNSKCRDCGLRAICYRCPARAYLEIGDEEAPVPYYCELAKGTARLMKKL